MTKTKSMIYCGLFTALIAAGAFIKIPVPVVPFTLQYLFTMLAGLQYTIHKTYEAIDIRINTYYNISMIRKGDTKDANES